MGLYFKSYINKDEFFYPIQQLVTYKGLIYTINDSNEIVQDCVEKIEMSPDKEILWMLQLISGVRLIATENTEIYTENGVKKLKDIEFGEKVTTIYPRADDVANIIAVTFLKPQYVFTLKTSSGKSFVNDILIVTNE